MKNLIIGLTLIASMSSLATESNVNRAFKCDVSEFDTSVSNIDQVDLEIVKNSMKITYKYTNYPEIFVDSFTHNQGMGMFTFTKDQFVFGYDGEHGGYLASFDEGKSYQGKAYIAQDFTVFLECR